MNNNEMNNNKINNKMNNKNTKEEVCDEYKITIYDIMDELNCTLHDAKLIYKYSNQYDLLDYDVIYDIINTSHSIDYIDSIFDIVICNNMKDYNTITTPQSTDLHDAMFNVMTCKNMYRCDYAYNKYYKSPSKQEVINYAIQYFKAFKLLCSISDINLNYMKARALESKEEQFIRLFDE